ncbi:MAG: hypothetical protein R2716_08800 [Microthrixaceae bacterium]
MVIETHFRADFLSGHLELAAPPAPRSPTAKAAEAEFHTASSPTANGSHSVRSCLEIRHTPGRTRSRSR